MTQEQLRHRLAATAEEIDHSSVPLDDIRQAGRSLQRRRARTRLAGLAAGVVAVGGVALVIPTLGPGSDGTAPATTPPGPDAADCRPGAIDDGTVEDHLAAILGCRTAPGPAGERWPKGGMTKAFEAELVSAGPAQRRAVEDDRVTRVEYDAGFDGYRRCLAEQGFVLGSVDRLGSVIQYVVPAEAVDAGADGSCYRRHFRVLDMVWQGTHAD